MADKQILKESVDPNAALRAKYPPNSHKSKEEKKEESKKVTKGKVSVKKQSAGKSFFNNFIQGDLKDVGRYILYDVVLPEAKEAIATAIKGGVEMLIYGEAKRGSRTSRDRGTSYVSYNSMSSRERDRDRRPTQSRSRRDVEEVILESRGDAEEVLSCLVDLTIDYGQASVSDLYDLAGITGSYTDNKYGWTDLGHASVKRVREGYILDLPKARVLD